MPHAVRKCSETSESSPVCTSTRLVVTWPLVRFVYEIDHEKQHLDHLVMLYDVVICYVFQTRGGLRTQKQNDSKQIRVILIIGLFLFRLLPASF